MSGISKTLSAQSDSNDYQKNFAVSRSKDEKQTFTDAVDYCITLSRHTGRLTDKPEEDICKNAIIMGLEMFHRIKNIHLQMDIETEDVDSPNIFESETELEPAEVVGTKDLSMLVDTDETSCEAASSSSEENSNSLPKTETEIPNEECYGPFLQSKRFTICDNSVVRRRNKSGSKPGVKKPLIPLEEKIKVVELARKHPTGNLKFLQENGSPRLLSMEQLKTWEYHISNGGTYRDKSARINDITYERFVEARKESKHVTAKRLKQWAVEASECLYGKVLGFGGGHHWFENFKAMYGLHYSFEHGYRMKDEMKS